MNVYQEIDYFYNRYRGKKCVIGKSAFGRDLFAFFVGDDDGPTGICQYAMHAREWITAYLALEHISRGVRGGVWFFPLINPDGALLATEGIGSVEDVAQRRFLIDINGGEDFSLWKANGEAVDLNVNSPRVGAAGSATFASPRQPIISVIFPSVRPRRVRWQSLRCGSVPTIRSVGTRRERRFIGGFISLCCVLSAINGWESDLRGLRVIL